MFIFPLPATGPKTLDKVLKFEIYYGKLLANNFPQEINNISFDDKYLKLSGGTMTGDLILNGVPTADNQAATKAYVDNKNIGTLLGSDVWSGSSGSVEILTTTIMTFSILRCVIESITATTFM